MTGEEQRRNAATLCRILDSCHDLRERQPQLSEQLWRSALSLADRIAPPQSA